MGHLQVFIDVLFRGIRVHIVGHRDFDDVNYQGRRLEAMVMRVTSVKPTCPP